MMIFYKPAEGNSVDAVVVLDYTRSDDQWSPAQIARLVGAGAWANSGNFLNPIPKIFSLDYSLSFTHSAINYADSLKTKFYATITNAPIELINLLNIKSIVSQENIDALENAATKIIDPELFFPTGMFVMKPNSNSNEIIKREFMVYSTPYNFDPRRINSSLTIHGASFDSMVIRLQFAVNIDTKFPLVVQLNEIFASQKIGVLFDESLVNLIPVVARYYPPATINSTMEQICRDNKLAFDIDSTMGVITLKSLDPNSPPPPVTEKLYAPITFQGYIPGSKIISTFSLQNYASCLFEGEAFDVDLFDSVSIYDDSFSTGLFDNLRKMDESIPAGKAILTGYRFYVLEYTFRDSRQKTSVEIRGTNNWLIGQFKLDQFLENKVYAGAAAG